MHDSNHNPINLAPNEDPKFQIQLGGTINSSLEAIFTDLKEG